ncbi:MAG: DoxX family membrane protein [Candidatus Omnitrophica bacterium]|nr:DoxX family membrane protein [Candidatus Omnitrophota bacterium]
MMNEKSYKILFLGRLFLGLVFAFSGYTKLIVPVENFRGAIAAYAVIPSVLIPLIAHAVPWMEFIFGAFLVVGYLPRVSAAMLAGLSWSFVLLIFYTWIATGTLPEDCGCFGEGSLIHLKPHEVVLLDIFNTIVGAKLALISDHPFSLAALLKPKGPSAGQPAPRKSK